MSDQGLISKIYLKTHITQELKKKNPIKKNGQRTWIDLSQKTTTTTKNRHTSEQKMHEDTFIITNYQRNGNQNHKGTSFTSVRKVIIKKISGRSCREKGALCIADGNVNW